MNAVNPVPTAASAEPSMEEILASIRRIIADDQSLPGHVGSPASPQHEATSEPPMASEPSHLEAHMQQAHMQREAPHPDTVAAPLDAPLELPPEHGVVATPQFVSPEGPPGVMDTPHPLAPPAPEARGSVGFDAAASLEPLQEAALREPDLHEAALHAMHDESDLNLHDFAREPPMAAHDASGEGPRGLFSAATSQSLAAAFNTLAVSRLVADSHELRGLAQEMLRPLLKDWLDENLPSMVEAIIRDEIDRLSRSAR